MAQSMAWGQLLLPGIKNWAYNVMWPQVVDIVEMDQDFETDSVWFKFRLISSGLWMTVPIKNEIFYESKNPTHEIMAIIKGSFVELLAPGMKAAWKSTLHAKNYGLGMAQLEELYGSFVPEYQQGPCINGVDCDWSATAIEYYLDKYFSEYKHDVDYLPKLKMFKIIMQYAGETWMRTYPIHWLDKNGVSKFLTNISQLVGIKNVNKYGITYAGKAAKEYGYDMMDYKSSPSRTNQFYEQGIHWIPVGLTLADVT